MNLVWLVAAITLFGQDLPAAAVDTGIRSAPSGLREQEYAPTHFDTDIIPILTKAGCNSGGCHGAAAGRGGFHLSLFGADPVADYEAIVHQFEGRRINAAKPELSLLLRKPTGELAHEGGTPLSDDVAGKDILLNWIRSGAERGQSRRLIEVEVQPKRKLIDSIPSAISLQVLAKFDDLTTRDVTNWTVLSVSDPLAIQIEDNRWIHVNRRGQHVVIARYLDRVIPVTISVPLWDTAVDLAEVPRVNFIDDQILQVLQELRIPPAPRAEDAEWLRRVTLDLTGRLPTPDEVHQFLLSDLPSKRDDVVDRLLVSEAYVDLWTLRFSRLLRMHSLPNETQPLTAYSTWIREAIRSDIGFDQLAKQLLTTTGDSHFIGPANFGRMVPDARAHAELVGQVFAGIRLGCANCHNHPLDKWTQDDYHGLAVIFAPLDRSRNVTFTLRAQVMNLRTGEPAVPRIPGVRDLTSDDDPLIAVSDWVTDDKDLLFARATTNRLWRFLFGRGLVEPTDDLRESNPATHPELLQQLAREFASNSYRLRPMLKTMVMSATYGRSDQTVAGNATDDRFYSHAVRRAFEPEVFLDAVADVTGIVGSFEPHRATRAVQVIDAALPSEVLDVLGRCQRVAGCEESESASGNLTAQLHLLNGDTINKRLRDPNGRLQQLITAHRSVVEIVDEFYLRGLGRHPTVIEIAEWKSAIEHADPVEQGRRQEDFVWSILNSRDFRENH